MRLFQARQDDFANIAADPERRYETIADLRRRSRWTGWSALLFTVVTVMMAWDQNVGAVCTGLFAALMFSFGARLEADVHLLQVLERMGDKHEPRMG
jgi:hypothetical protein